MRIVNVANKEASMPIKKWRTAAAYRVAAVVGVAVSAALIMSACEQSPTVPDSVVGNGTTAPVQSVVNGTAVRGPTLAAKTAKVDVCHRRGNGSFHLINVNGNALAAHIGHGDGQPGDLVPGATISVIQGLYGGNCGTGFSHDPNFPPFPPINFGDSDTTAHLAFICDGQENCDYLIDHTVIGDPFFGCSKDYQAEWACVTKRFDDACGQVDAGPPSLPLVAFAFGEATGKTVNLSCGGGGGEV